MGLTSQYIKTLGLNDDESYETIDKMPEEQAKEILKIIISLNNEEQREGSKIELNGISPFAAQKD